MDVNNDINDADGHEEEGMDFEGQTMRNTFYSIYIQPSSSRIFDCYVHVNNVDINKAGGDKQDMGAEG